MTGAGAQKPVFFPTRRAGGHERFFMIALRFAYAQRVIHVKVDQPVYPRLALAAWRGLDAIEEGCLEAVFVAGLETDAELRRILETSRPADRRRYYWLQLSKNAAWDPNLRRARRLKYEEKVETVMREFGVSRRQVERDIAKATRQKPPKIVG
jgi:hypothetical protein